MEIQPYLAEMKAQVSFHQSFMPCCEVWIVSLSTAGRSEREGDANDADDRYKYTLIEHADFFMRITLIATIAVHGVTTPVHDIPFYFRYGIMQNSLD